MTDNTAKIEKSLEDSVRLKMSLSVYIKFGTYIIREQVSLFIKYAVFLVFMASLTPIFTYIWKRYMDLASEGTDVIFSLLLLAIYVLTKALLDLCYFFSMSFMDTINFASWRTLDKAINEKAVKIHSEYFEIPNIQNRINRAWEFSHGSYVRLYQTSLNCVLYTAQAIGIFIALWIINPAISGVALLTIIPTIVSKIIGDKLSIVADRQLTDDENECNYYKNTIFDQSLVKDIATTNSFEFFYKKYKYKAAEVYHKHRNIEIEKTKLLFFEEILRNIVIIICILFVSYQVILGNASVGGLAATFAIIFNLIYTLSSLAQNIGTVFTLTYQIKQFYEFMDLDSEITIENTDDLIKEKSKFEFKNVSYRYPLMNKYALCNINVTIEEGQHISIVGANGSGKTTFIKLLLGLLTPSIGEIRNNGVNLSTVDKQKYWNMFSAVFQDYSKYKDSLRYNVSISDIDSIYVDDKIKRVLSVVGFRKDINLDCMLSKEFGGVELSGGEWQKIALARAIFHHNSIFILDEPTSAIDPVKEIKLYEQFAEMTKGKTSIFVTHRLGSVLNSDLVSFFQNGEIVEIGTHDELVALKGQYYKFWNAQVSLYNK